jgi:RNA polymerase sigma factor (sigma-70 family)
MFREHNDSLVRFIAARLGSKQEASEVAQEAYVRLLSLDNEAAVSFLRAFLFKTAGNLATDRLRARSRRGFIVTTGSVEKAVFELSPERELEGEQAIEHLRQAIDELPQKCREAFYCTGSKSSVVQRSPFAWGCRNGWCGGI